MAISDFQVSVSAVEIAISDPQLSISAAELVTSDPDLSISTAELAISGPELSIFAAELAISNTELSISASVIGREIAFSVVGGPSPVRSGRGRSGGDQASPDGAMMRFRLMVLFGGAFGKRAADPNPMRSVVTRRSVADPDPFGSG